MKLHLGCGKKYLKGYVHIDLADYPHIDYKSRIDKLPMIDNESVDLIYVSHALEYFDQYEVKDVLSEWYRKLKHGGILRLAVPDFQKLITVYKETNDLLKIIGPLYGRWKVPGSNLILYHKIVYDEKLLINVLKSVGFTEVRNWSWREVFIGENKDFDDYSQAYFPHMDKENGLLISLNIEAIK